MFVDTLVKSSILECMVILKVFDNAYLKIFW